MLVLDPQSASLADFSLLQTKGNISESDEETKWSV